MPNLIKKVLIVGVILFVAVMAALFLTNEDKKNGQPTLTSGQFITIATEAGYDVISNYSYTHRENGIKEHVTVEKKVDDKAFRVQFYILENDSVACEIFSAYYEMFDAEETYTNKQGSLNECGLFANSQDYLFGDGKNRRRLVRVKNIFIYSMTENLSQDKEVVALFKKLDYNLTIYR